MIYAFYPLRADGSSIAFDLIECPDDPAAEITAVEVLRRHASAVEVEFWEGERRAGAVAREPA